MIYALVDPTGLVCQIEQIQFPVHSDFQWIDITNANPMPAYGWTYSNSMFSAPVPETQPSVTVDQQLGFTDYTMARGYEELVPLLITNNIIPRNAFDPYALANINARRTLRGQSAI